MVDMSLNPNTINYIITAVPKDGSAWPNGKTGGGDNEKTESLRPNLYWLDVKIFDESDFVRVCMFLCPQVYRTGSVTLLRVAISSVETRKSRDFLWWKLRGISEEVTRVQRVAWKTSVEILATSVWSSV